MDAAPGMNVQQVDRAVGGLPPRVLENVRHRGRLVHQLQISIGMDVVVRRTAEYAAVHERAMDLM